MKTKSCFIIAVLTASQSFAQPLNYKYRSFVRQTQLASGVAQDAELVIETNPDGSSIDGKGSLRAPLPIAAGGARFDIYSVAKVAPYTSHLLNSAVVGIKVKASIVIDTEDPYGKANSGAVTYANPSFVPLTGNPLPKEVASAVRRTRVDRPFKVYVTTSGFSPVATDPDNCKRVDFRRQVLSYGLNNTGLGVSLTPALYAATPQSSFSVATTTCNEYMTQIPSPSIQTTRGEEIFSVWTLNDSQVVGHTIPPNMLASSRVQICPMTVGTISGISPGQNVRFVMPKLTFNFVNTYPNSDNYARIYQGPKRSGVPSVKVPGSGKVNSGNDPETYLATSGDDLNPLITSDGTWTIELVTYVDCFKEMLCLTYVTFEIDRSIKANGNFTTIE